MSHVHRLLLAIPVLLLAFGSASAPRGQEAPPAGTSYAGELLVASPDLADPHFAQSVIYVVAHSNDGALGLIVNEPVKQVTFAELFRLLHLDGDAADGTLSVHYGGPVEPRLGFVLHSRDLTLGEDEIVAGDLAVTTEPEMLRRIAASHGPARYLFALGYAGWAPNQLETEVGRGDWFVIPADASLIFTDHPEESWKRALARRSTPL